MTTSLPKRRKKPRRQNLMRVPGHRQWVRGHECIVGNAECDGGIECAHVRSGTDGGTGMKPHDKWTVPLCRHHHREQHGMGEGPFEAKYRLRMKEIAAKLWAVSDHGKRHRREYEMEEAR